MSAPQLQSNRLILRQWGDDDLPYFASLNADPRVMEFFLSTLSKQESDDLAKRIQKELKSKPYGLWAVEIPTVASFAGFVGLHEATFKAHFTPAIEIGWRLAYEHWGKGYAQEAANTVIDYAFNALNLSEIVSFTYAGNHRSIKLMERLGMKRNPDDDFDNPNLPGGHWLKPHVLYRLLALHRQ